MATQVCIRKFDLSSAAHSDHPRLPLSLFLRPPHCSPIVSASSFAPAVCHSRPKAHCMRVLAEWTRQLETLSPAPELDHTGDRAWSREHGEGGGESSRFKCVRSAVRRLRRRPSHRRRFFRRATKAADAVSLPRTSSRFSVSMACAFPFPFPRSSSSSPSSSSSSAGHIHHWPIVHVHCSSWFVLFPPPLHSHHPPALKLHGSSSAPSAHPLAPRSQNNFVRPIVWRER